MIFTTLLKSKQILPTPSCRWSSWQVAQLFLKDLELDPWPLHGRRESWAQAAGATCYVSNMLGYIASNFHQEIPSQAGIITVNCRLLSSYISHLQNLFRGSILLIFFVVEEEWCHLFMLCLWAVEVCAVTVKILNLNLVNHSVCCPCGSALYSQFYFIQCHFLGSLLSSNIVEL